jgi:ATPase subunit of ABC transporter with duplicated ATPase domains
VTGVDVAAMISVSNLAKSFGDRTLFSGMSFQLDSGQRYGLVGANGSGKTTLLGVMSGDDEATEGTVSIPRDVRLGVLRQDQFLYEDEEILGVTLMGNPALWRAMSEKEQLLAAAEADPEAPFDAHRFSELEETVQLYDGYTAEARAARILEGLGIPAHLHREPLSVLSGGFKLRVLLAQVLASAPDVLLLDEPTNHLDILSIRWLETFLEEFAGPAVVISHDHRFLDNVSTRILDVDYETVTLYKGNYTAFVDAKREERERRQKEIEGREKEIAHHQVFVDRFRAKASKARQAQSKLRMIEKKAGELEALPGSSRRYPKFRFQARRPSGKGVLKLDGIVKAYDDNQVLHGVDLEVRRGDRLAVIGPNGIGKSTLLRIAVGDVDADAGEVEWGHETHVGYFAQDHHEQLSAQDRTIEEWLWDYCPGKDRGYVRGHLGMVLFSGEEGAKRLGALSGGEAARLMFARIALERPNVLVLDEPTNHLDLESIEALVEGLQSFEGTLILVSHDRWFVSRLATRVVEIRADGILDYPGSYQEYVHACGDDHLDADTVVLRARREGRKKGDPEGGRGRKGAAPKGNQGRRGTPSRSSNARRHRELEAERDEVTTRITALEGRLAEIDEAFCAPDFYDRSTPDEVSGLEAERAALSAEADERMRRWEQVELELGALEQD